MVIAVYPGTFDPLTRGHEDLVRRAAGLFSRLVVGVADSRAKKPFFVLDERISIARECCRTHPNVGLRDFAAC
jgi:pantetheine-phosphate adenylyltransferase